MDLSAVARAARAWLDWHAENGSEGFVVGEAPARSNVPQEISFTSPRPPSNLPKHPPPRESSDDGVPEAVREMMKTRDGEGTLAANVPIVRAPKEPVRALPLVATEVSTCVKCGLAATRKNTVFSRGNPKSRIVFVGEAPGQDEDEQGIPFVGPAGQLLDKMIAAMGLNPETDVYVCNIIKCRPPENRQPEPDEIATCMPYLHEQLGNVEPEAIVAMGNTAVQALLATTMGITKVRGAWKLYRGSVPLMPTYHPSYLLRSGPTQQESKRHAWEDLQLVMKKLGLTAPKRG